MTRSGLTTQAETHEYSYSQTPDQTVAYSLFVCLLLLYLLCMSHIGNSTKQSNRPWFACF